MAKILVVDDSDAVRAQLKKDISAGGHDVIEASDGVDGLSKLKATNDVQLVISDVNMPNMDGLTMVKNLRQIEHYAKVPVLMLTTETNAEMKKIAKDVGVRAWIGKPHVAAKLMSAISTILIEKK